MSEHWAVIPVKGLADSKTRLSSFLGERKKLLVEALLQDVLSSILRSRVYDKVLVVSPDDSVSALARYSVSSPRISFDAGSVNDLIELKRGDPEARTVAPKALREIWQTASPARLSSIAE